LLRKADKSFYQDLLVLSGSIILFLLQLLERMLRGHRIRGEACLNGGDERVDQL
jgi:hypothetical protein